MQDLCDSRIQHHTHSQKPSHYAPTHIVHHTPQTLVRTEDVPMHIGITRSPPYSGCRPMCSMLSYRTRRSTSIRAG